MPADIRKLAQEAVGDGDIPADCPCGVCVERRRCRTIARALIEVLDSSRSWDDAHNDACKELDRALADRDAALRNLRVTSEALSEVAQDRDKILAALPHALGSCGCEGIVEERDHGIVKTHLLRGMPEEHEAAIEWLRGRIE